MGHPVQRDATSVVLRCNGFFHLSAKHACYVQSTNLRELNVTLPVNREMDDYGRVRPQADPQGKAVAWHNVPSSQRFVRIDGL